MHAVKTALLAIDVGGSTSRAYLVDPAGVCLGYGRNRGGNPASNAPDLAAAAIVSAAEAAVAAAGVGRNIVIAQIALAGPQKHVALGQLETGLRRLGLTGPIAFAGDLLAMFASVTPSPDGYCVVAGTGAGAVRIRGGRIDAVADAAGWLLGDSGSGYWLGHQAARAAVAALDGRDAQTALSKAIIENLGIAWSEERGADSRPRHLRELTDAIYGLRPIELARFAPLVVANRSDPVAARLIAEAEDHLVADFETVFDGGVPGPVALGGGVISYLDRVAPRISEILRAKGRQPDIRPVTDGSVGAIVLALRALGTAVDETMFQTIAGSVAARSR